MVQHGMTNSENSDELLENSAQQTLDAIMQPCSTVAL